VPLSPDGFSNFQNASETKSLDDDIMAATLKLYARVRGRDGVRMAECCGDFACDM
jgi:hypothetical protein